MPEGIDASSKDATDHISRLWDYDFRDIALDAGRDPGRSNLTAVRLVADMRMAEETRRLAEETRKLRIWTCIAAVGAVVAALAAAVGLILATDDPDGSSNDSNNNESPADAEN